MCSFCSVPIASIAMKGLFVQLSFFAPNEDKFFNGAVVNMMKRYFVLRRKENLFNTILFIALIVLILTLYMRDPSRFHLPSNEEIHWTEVESFSMFHKIPDFSKKRTGPGENGEGVQLEGKQKVQAELDMKHWFMNLAASDMISLDRSLPDYRHEKCLQINYTDLPKASVVVIFTDEAWSPLMRTVHSVINRTPLNLLQEVILVDDFSQRDELKDKLEKYIERFGGIVHVKRAVKRQGLIRARLLGAKEASGDVLVFLDSHCEVTEGWLEPLLARIKEKRTAVLCPIIDHISAETMAYSGSSDVSMVGGFWWSLHFRWDSLSQKNFDVDPTLPVRSPTMAGGLLAADRKYFFEIGGYDPGMDIWGGENLELSFRVWMCGGSIEFIPCSHVGHIFRNGHPYNMTGPGNNKDVHGTNSKRLAEVWMDDYKRFYYWHRRDLKNKEVGDLSERKALRKQLKCKSFKWYLQNVATNKFIYDEDVAAFGVVRNSASQLCLDTLQRDEKTVIFLGVFSCQSGGSQSQLFSLTHDGHLRREMTCATVDSSMIQDNKTTVWLVPCDIGGIGKWVFENGSLRHQDTGFCLDVSGLKSGDDVLARSCRNEADSQSWEFVENDFTDL